MLPQTERETNTDSESKTMREGIAISAFSQCVTCPEGCNMKPINWEKGVIPEGFPDFKLFSFSPSARCEAFSCSLVTWSPLCVKLTFSLLLSSTSLKLHMTASRGCSWFETSNFSVLVSTVKNSLWILERNAPVFKFRLSPSRLCHLLYCCNQISAHSTSVAKAISLIELVGSEKIDHYFLAAIYFSQLTFSQKIS